MGVVFHEPIKARIKPDTYEDQESTLSASDLASILKWSKDISSDINLASGEWVAFMAATLVVQGALSSTATHRNSHR